MIDQGAHVDEQGDRADDYGGRGDHADGWLTLGAAAEALGLSVVSVRRRIRAGQLRARQVKTARGPAWRVCLDPDERDDHRDGHGARGATTVIEGLTAPTWLV